jgi:2-polyprenyl-6-methoxyphenol hydroxylase-like FAD-dependent oxidoreductase
MPMSEREMPVVIVGGSLVGLTLSALLAAQKIPHLLVERHRGTAIHPRAASFHQRTMEIFRSIGLQQAVEQAAAREFVQNGAIVAVDSLAGRELACFYRSFNEGVEGLSPTARLFITQVGLEPLLRKRAAELGAEHLFGTELAEFAQDETGVTVILRPRDGGPEERIRARYLVAADGAHSPVRQALGIAMQGRGSFADCATIYFRADMRALIRGRALSVVYVNRPDQLSFFRFAITEDAGFLAVFATSGAKPDSPERCAELVRTALGVAEDYPVEIENVQHWNAMAATAAAFRRGRVFLAGDAAHVMPPTGGFGGNTGVADAHNLAWKLAMVASGEAGEALLDSYDSERRPAAELVVEQAYARYVQRVDPSLPADDLAPLLDDAAIELGTVYRSTAVVGADGGPDPLDDPHAPSAHPGTRMPHVVLSDGTSTLDLARDAFALITASPAWADAAAGLPLAVHLLDDAKALGIGEGALILRPDGVIGWRDDTARPDAEAELRYAVALLAAREEAAQGDDLLPLHP